MARTDTLQHFLTDVADSIRAKTGGSGEISADAFDSAIGGISGGADLSQYFNYQPQSISSSAGWVDINYIIKLEPLEIPNSVTSLYRLCYGSRMYVLPKVICGSNVTNFSEMYNACTNVETIDASSITINSTENINFNTMFKSCQHLTNFIPFSINKTSGTVDTSTMFSSCSALTELDLSDWDFTASALSSMFAGCTSLTSLKIPKIKNGSIYAHTMFQNCSSLQFLDVRGINFSYLRGYNNMMNNVPTNCEIIVKDNTEKTWFNTKFSSYTNVKTVSEYEQQ